MKNNSILRISLLLFLIVIFFSLVSGFSFFFIKSNTTRLVFIAAYFITFLLGAFIYQKLWIFDKSKGNRNSLLYLWILMIVCFVTVPCVFFCLVKINDSKNEEANLLYEKQHCKEVVTKQHGYRLEECENGNLIGDSVSIEEYTRETK